MASIFEALADPTRQRILALLLAGERPVGELVDELGVAQPSVSKHLAKLKAAGLVAQRAEAQKRHYRLTPEPLQALEGWLQPYLQPPPVEEAVKVVRTPGSHGWTLGFETTLAASPEAVWAALTEPERLKAWLGKATVDRQAERFRLTFLGGDMILGGRILTWDAQHKLACRWRINPKGAGPATPIATTTFELSADPKGTRLAATVKDAPDELAGELAALWQAHLERLGPALAGEAPAWSDARLEALRAEFA